MTPAVLITGSAGFIGSHACQRYLALGHRVVGVDNLDAFYETARKRANIASSAARANELGGSYEQVEADITDAAAMRTLFERVRPALVVHLAARAGVRPSLADPVGYAHANVTGTASVLEASRAAGVKAVVVASSSSVYGENGKVPFAETDDVSMPVSPYAATKRSCELLAASFFARTNIPVACLRFFTVFGPRQRPDLAIQKFFERAKRGEEIEVFGDGGTSRDYTYIDDVIDGVVAAGEKIPAHGYRIWNLGSDRPVSLSRLVELIGEVSGKPLKVRRGPDQPGDVPRTWADLTRVRTELGYAPRTSFAEGLARQWAAVAGA